MQKVLEQQHQHNVDTQHRRQHGQAKTGKQLAHDFSIANHHLLDASRQVFQGWQLVDRLGHIAQWHA